MNKIKIFQEKVLQALEIMNDDRMLQIKGGLEDKTNRPGAKPNKKGG